MDTAPVAELADITLNLPISSLFIFNMSRELYGAISKKSDTSG